MVDRSDIEFGNGIWIEYHKQNLEVCKQLVKDGRLVPAKVILDLMDKNLNG